MLNAGIASLALDKLDKAQEYFDKTMAMRQSEQRRYFDQKYNCYTTKAKLSHDAAQFRYLSKTALNKCGVDKIADNYEQLISEIDWGKSSQNTIQLSENELLKIAKTYNRPFHIYKLPKVNTDVINPFLEAETISLQYDKSTPKLAYFDHFLTADALVNLRRFLLESTIWYDFSHIEGQLAAYLENGLANPLLLKIAYEIKNLLPHRHPFLFINYLIIVRK